ncbi:hypothetical protein EHRUM3_00740 [Ehrlichia ruminantium]|uniref:Uncharacterized protein n=1 Tax=Ehrlichia ruminantium TaxID=779 RepID=A0A170RKH2_EHRRU|nr:hypothetical protein EHRUM2_00610 [Ehrlichia ruminantium]GAT77874.1 hypothetical protein EHRUM3_00740 [Ehrlichia ruminantium]
MERYTINSLIHFIVIYKNLSGIEVVDMFCSDSVLIYFPFLIKIPIYTNIKRILVLVTINKKKVRSIFLIGNMKYVV